MRLFPIVLIGCSPVAGFHDVTGPSTSGAPAPLSVDAAPAFDPVTGPLAFAVTGSPGRAITVTVGDGTTVLHSTEVTVGADGTGSGSWDASNNPPAPGPLMVTASDGASEAADASAVVRPGLATANIADDGGYASWREPLFWRAANALQDLGAPISVVDGWGDFPAVSDELAWVPDDGSQPVALRFDSRPLLVLTVPTASDRGGTGLDDAIVEVVADGWSPVGDARLVPGGTVTLQLDAPLSDTVGVTEIDLVLGFEAVDGDERWPVGEQRLPLRIYRTLGPQASGYFEDIYHPWPFAIDAPLRAIEGTPAEHDAVLDALVAWVYDDTGLTYDTVAGASFYSEYVGFDWDRPRFYMTDFVLRRNGSVVNCSDNGNIVVAHANMLGAEQVHIVILSNFGLNYIQAIGHNDFTSCPFGPGGCGFSYHAVTTGTVNADLIWDSTLALDGDGDPGALPSTELLVQSITGAEYLDRLVRSGNPSYQYPSRVSIE